MANRIIPAQATPADTLAAPAAPGRPARSTALALTRRDGFRSLVVFVAAALILLVADIVMLQMHPGGYRIEVGNYRDEFFVSGVNYQQVAPDGKRYRWTTGQAMIWLSQLGVTRHAALTLELGGRPEPSTVQLALNDQPWVDVTAATVPRHVRLLLPGDVPRMLAIGLNSPTFAVAGDPRPLGVKLEGFQVDLIRGGLPLPTRLHYAAQLGLILAVQLTVLRLGMGWRGQTLVTGALALVLAVLLSGALLLAYSYLPHLAIAAGLLALLTWVVLPQLERLASGDSWLGDYREVRVIWAIMLIACAIRLIGLLYPTFDGQDLGRNVRRQLMSLGGQMYIFSGSAEFARGQTIYPTGPYLFLMPGILFTSNVGALIETVLTILEGTTAFLVAVLVRRLGGNRDAARFAALLFLGSYASFSIHVYQFSAQIYGQWFTAAVALVLLAGDGRPTFRQWAFAILLLMFGVFSHIGVAILGISWMGIMLLLALRRHAPEVWRAIGLFALCVVGAAVFMYLDIIAETLTHTGTVLENQAGGVLFPGATPGLLKGLRLAYSDVGILLLPGLLLLLTARPRLDRLIVPLGLVLTVLFYLAVDLTLKLQVRYFYFALPLAIGLIALALGRLAARGGAGRTITWALVAVLTLQGVTLWFSTTFADGQISMTPLTH